MFIASNFVLAWKILRSRAGSVTLILGLVVGVGLALTVYTLLAAVLRTPLPYGDPDSIVRVWNAGGTSESLRLLDVSHMRRLTQTSSPLAAAATFVPVRQRLQLPSQRSVEIAGAMVGTDLFDVLRTPPLRGETLSRSLPVGEPPVVVSQRLIRDGIVGGDLHDTLMLDGVAHRVVGVMAAEFWFPDRSTNYWTLMPLEHGQAPDASSLSLPVIARLADGVSCDAAMSEANAMIQAGDGRGQPVQVVIESYASSLYEHLRPSLAVLQGAAVALLLLVGINVAWLSIALADRLAPTVATLRSLGIPSSSSVAVYLAIRMYQAVLAVPLVIAAAWLLLQVTVAFESGAISAVADPGVTAHVMLAGAIATVVLVALASLPGAIRVARHAAAGAPASRTHTSRRLLAGRVVMATQLTLVCAMTAQAVLLAGVLRDMVRVNVGYPRTTFMAVPVAAQPASAVRPEAIVGSYTAILSDLDRRGVRASMTNVLPLTSADKRTYVGAPGVDRRHWNIPLRIRLVTPTYFDVTGVTATRGRIFQPDDRGTRRAVVNDAFVRIVFEGRDPIGARMAEWAPWVPWLSELTFVGVVANMKQLEFTDDEIPEIYVLYEDYTALRQEQSLSDVQSAVFLADSQRGSSETARMLRETVQAHLPGGEVGDATLMKDLVDARIGSRRLVGVGASLFAGIAIVLVGIGVYGMTSDDVTARVRECGMRMALGATPASLVAVAVRPVLAIVGAGLVAGVVLMTLTRSVIESLFVAPPGITYPTSAAMAATVAAVVCAATAIACAQPLWRVLRTDPVRALRTE